MSEEKQATSPSGYSLNMQKVLNYGPMQIGLAFLPDTIAMAALSIGLSARLITRFSFGLRGPSPRLSR